MSKLKYLFVSILYLGILIFSMVILYQYEEFFDGDNVYALNSFSTLELIAYLLYKFPLNFPLTIFNWFLDSTMYLTIFFAIPNGIATVFLFEKLKMRKTQNQV